MQAHLLPLSLADPAVSGVKVGGTWAKHTHRYRCSHGLR